MIKKMQIDEIKNVQKVASLTYETTYRKILPTNIQLDYLKLAYSFERLKQRMKSSRFFVFQQQSEIIGYANFSQVNRQGNSELLAIYILEQYQRQGIGTKFLSYFQNEFPAVKTITINLEADNKPALSFAEEYGFICKEQFIENFQGVYLHMKRYTYHIQDMS